MSGNEQVSQKFPHPNPDNPLISKILILTTTPHRGNPMPSPKSAAASTPSNANSLANSPSSSSAAPPMPVSTCPPFARVSRYLNDTRRRGEIPDAESVVLRLLTWAESDRYRAHTPLGTPRPHPVTTAISQIGYASAFHTVDNGLSMEYSSRTLSPMMASGLR